jgi:hypothetical protein
VGRTFSIGGVSASRALPAAAGLITHTFNSKMTVFEASETARPPVNVSSETNAVVVSAPAPTTNPTSTTTSTFFFNGLGLRTAARDESGRPLTVSSDLDVPGGSGQIVVNGRNAAYARRGRSASVAVTRRGENRVEAQLVEGSGAGSWRFELGGASGREPGSLRVVAGDVALITGDAVVFRLSGRSGERVVFTFRARE